MPSAQLDAHQVIEALGATATKDGDKKNVNRRNIAMNLYIVAKIGAIEFIRAGH